MTEQGSRPLAPGSRSPRRGREEPAQQPSPIGEVADFLSTQYPEASWTAVKETAEEPAAPRGTIPERVDRLEGEVAGTARAVQAELAGRLARVQADLAAAVTRIEEEMGTRLSRIEDEVTTRLGRIEERLAGSIGALGDALTAAGPRMEALDKHLAITVRQAHDLRRLLEEERGEGLLVMEVEKAVVELRQEIVTRLDQLAGDLGLEFRLRAAGSAPRAAGKPRKRPARASSGDLMFPEVEDPAATATASMRDEPAPKGGSRSPGPAAPD